MFGYVQANPADLSPEEKVRYRAAYCGLCRTLNERHGFFSKLALTYDLTFLALLLSSLYEPEETHGESRCVVHPCKKHVFMVNSCTEYASDMTIALTYYKCLDDWHDEHRLVKKSYAFMLSTEYERVKSQWPEQCHAIENCIQALSLIEKEKTELPDTAANCFGALMSSLFVFKKDRWEPQLRALGFSLGRYIYLSDAAVDFKKDEKHGNYNPLAFLSVKPEEFRPTLMMVLGEASQAFETLPLVQDIHLLRNILYSGIWIKYNQEMQAEREKSKK